MAELIRKYEWEPSPLGPIGKWPPALVVSVNALLASQMPMVLLWGPEFTHFYNDSFRMSLGPDKHPSCLGRHTQHCWPEIWERIKPKVEAVLELGESTWFENQYLPIPSEGKLRDAYWTYSYSPVRGTEGGIDGILVICQETTPLVHSKRKLHSVLEATADAVLGVDREWRINSLNQRAVEMLSPVSSDLMGANLWAAFPAMADEGSAYVEHYRRAMDHGTPGEFEAHYPEPLNLWLRIVVRPVADGILFFCRDITQRRREYAALIQSEKLAAIGKMASSIAHEINNPLESLTNLLYLLENLDEGKQRKQFLKQAQSELNRIARITTQTLRFHRQSTQPQLVQLTDVLENVLALTQGRRRGSSVAITTQYRTQRPVYALEADLRQVFANFISNALDAVGKEGHIVLRVQEATDPQTGRPMVRVVIADNGHGMDRSTRKRIFEPFFTTRPLTGTGLGLWVSMEILKQHGAKVRMRSTQNSVHHGTVFSMSFPSERPDSLTSAN